MHNLNNKYGIRKYNDNLTSVEGYCMPSYCAEPSKDWHFRPGEGCGGS